MPIKVNWALDKSDERDYKYSDVFEWVVWAILPTWKIIDLWTDYQNQSLEEITKYMCVFYNTAHWTNILNIIEWSEVFSKWKDLWLEAIDKWLLNPKSWAYIVNWPKLLKSKGLIKWYTLIHTLEEIKHSIAQNKPVSTWSNKINWRAWLKAPYILSEWPSYWHAFLIIWYDDDKELLTIKNSYWKWKFDNWKNYLKYSDIWLLFNSKYSLIDSEDPILTYKKKIMDWINLEEAKKMFELWYWNWERPTESMSREEVMTVLSRVMKDLEKKFNQTK